MWCDHRARDEAELINRGGYQVLRRVGGRISPEMEPPRLLWLKRHMPHSFQRIKHAFDLPDYLTYRYSYVAKLYLPPFVVLSLFYKCVAQAWIEPIFGFKRYVQIRQLKKHRYYWSGSLN